MKKDVPNIRNKSSCQCCKCNYTDIFKQYQRASCRSSTNLNKTPGPGYYTTSLSTLNTKGYKFGSGRGDDTIKGSELGNTYERSGGLTMAGKRDRS